MKLFVSNLPFDTSEEELREVFERFGSVASVKIVLDRDTGRSRGFGFVAFESSSNAEEAMQQLDGFSMGGRNLVVKIAHDKERPARR